MSLDISDKPILRKTLGLFDRVICVLDVKSTRELKDVIYWRYNSSTLSISLLYRIVSSEVNWLAVSSLAIKNLLISLGFQVRHLQDGISIPSQGKFPIITP